jgi:hypothetical protein
VHEEAQVTTVIIATIVLAFAIPALLSCAFWVLWEKDLKEINEAAEREAWK